ncbi:hypothetical protein ACH5RR_032808 [Cinchona calisaya]|uniref:F-box/kelch-repeat protein n=1 Tax=Cinchona calisaya TaxID=153742 RepID=A0ABD2YJ79_9GENT
MDFYIGGLPRPNVRIVGFSNGLVCIDAFKHIFLWNPSIKKSKRLLDFGSKRVCYTSVGYIGGLVLNAIQWEKIVSLDLENEKYGEITKKYGVKESWTNVVLPPSLYDPWFGVYCMPMFVTKDGKILFKGGTVLELHNPENNSVTNVTNLDAALLQVIMHVESLVLLNDHDEVEKPWAGYCRFMHSCKFRSSTCLL